MQKMRPAFVIEIETPKKYLLNGLWFGPAKPKRAIIFIHGLTASAFSMSSLVAALVDPQTAVITFNNRGFEQITEIKRKKGKKSVWEKAGAGHEVFTECADDIQGAINFVKKAGVRNIFLAGHSTGCQKAYYWARKKNESKNVKGIILLGPLSDYAIAVEKNRGGKLARSVAYARKLVKAGKAHQLMPGGFGMWFPCDAQRFLSLNTRESVEDIFPYGQEGKDPKAFRSVKAPTLVLLAGGDEHTNVPAEQIAEWFEWHFKAPYRINIIQKVGHGFKGGEKEVVREIRSFMKGTR
jgi:pimeloyl-ACP methyl ester carboxylesterase